MTKKTDNEHDAAAAAIVAKVQALAATLHTTDVRTRAEIGVEVTRYSEKTGTSETDAVKLIAELTQLHPSTIYDCLKVARAFSLKRLDDILKRKMKNGKTLTFSHVVVLSGVTDEQARNTWVDRCFANQWSVRDLEAALNERVSAYSPQGRTEGGAPHMTRREPIPGSGSPSGKTDSRAALTGPLPLAPDAGDPQIVLIEGKPESPAEAVRIPFGETVQRGSAPERRLAAQVAKIEGLGHAIRALRTVVIELGSELPLMRRSNLQVLDQVLSDAVTCLQELQDRVRSLSSVAPNPTPADRGTDVAARAIDQLRPLHTEASQTPGLISQQAPRS